ncbi:ArsR family transcriptional regulator [Paenibacillus elgii]|uniref:ArsR family transcriptional regulator n=1 Tax=Paenibacillus elgii TaxID=189691 RepID=A0A163Y1V8_9BACL|nr:metalloregulator ArsR/SmtB family transcription factor [Paenibacillus elgii]KZE78777.1 ArsR family transcriptional regulator [Paenibacillus elgii]MCM3271719.1 metalloregulator ArsR/SmtB family transcription factor [Paenibacillus elgii]
MEASNCQNRERVLETFQLTTAIFQALGDENRQHIIMLLLEHGSLNVNQITDRMEISRPAVSHHLKILRQAGLITFDRNGNEKFYSISSGEFLVKIKNLIAAIEAGI